MSEMRGGARNSPRILCGQSAFGIADSDIEWIDQGLFPPFL